MTANSASAYLVAGAEFLVILLHLSVISGVLLARRRDPTATLAWILFIVVAPFLGAIAYLIAGHTRLRRATKRVGRAELRMREVLSQCEPQGQGLENRPSLPEARTKAQLQLGNALASTQASSGNAVCLLNDAGATYRDVLAAIQGARDHIHVQFYIIQPDRIGRGLRDLLTQRAAAGVEVRVLCDAIGSRSLPADFWEPLRAQGGKFAYFAPLNIFSFRIRRRDRMDFRNHRKIIVVDGRVGFTGGINVGREYLGLDPSIGRWRDTHIRLEGPAVMCLQQVFAQDWLMTTGEALDEPRYFSCGTPAGDCQVQVIDSGPDSNWSTMELYHAQAILFARERVYITNPYFIPSQTIESALTLVALRGVDVRLLLPKKSDSALVTHASRSYYNDLLQANVRIFEYEHGFVHSKTMVIDDWVATIGSANMDMRSFNLNFELNVFVFDAALCTEVTKQFTIDLAEATEVSLEMERRVGIVRRLIRAVARLLSPML